MRRTLLLTTALFVAIACGDRKSSAAADSELTRDLSLANQTQAQPEFRDTALTAPTTTPTPRVSATTKTKTRTPVPRPTAPARTTAPQIVNRPRPAAPEPAQEVAVAPAPAPRAKGFGAGTSFGLTTKSVVCTTNLPGDKIVATIGEPVHGDDGALIPAGTSVVLEVASVTPGDTPEHAQITLRIRSIDLNEQAIRAEGDVAILSPLQRHEQPRDKNSDRRKVVTGAVAGAVLGQIMGRDTKSTVIGAAAGAAAGTAAAMAGRKFDACLPAGANLKVTTTQQISVSD